MGRHTLVAILTVIELKGSVTFLGVVIKLSHMWH